MNSFSAPGRWRPFRVSRPLSATPKRPLTSMATSFFLSSGRMWNSFTSDTPGSPIYLDKYYAGKCKQLYTSYPVHRCKGFDHEKHLINI